MVTLAPLIVLVGLLLVMVLAGKLINEPEPRHRSSARPALYVAGSVGAVYRNGQPIRPVETGDTMWVIRAGDGTPVIFADSTGANALGVTDILLWPVRGDPPR